MSRTVDAERAEDARDAKLKRTQALLEELLVLVKARREDLPINVIAVRMQRHRNHVPAREELLETLLKVIGRKGYRSGT